MKNNRLLIDGEHIKMMIPIYKNQTLIQLKKDLSKLKHKENKLP